MVRAALYVGMARQYVDERGFELIRKMRLASTDHQKLTLAQFKAMVREQFFMLLIDEEAALAAIPALLPPGADERQAALAAIRDVISASGEPTGEAAEQNEADRQAVRRRKATPCAGRKFLKASSAKGSGSWPVYRRQLPLRGNPIRCRTQNMKS